MEHPYYRTRGATTGYKLRGPAARGETAGLRNDGRRLKWKATQRPRFRAGERAAQPGKGKVAQKTTTQLVHPTAAESADDPRNHARVGVGEGTTALGWDAEDAYLPEPPPAPREPLWKDGSVRIGIHTSIAGDLTGALEIANKLGCNALQIFSSSPRMWPRSSAAGGTRIPEADAARFRARREELGLGPLVIHDNYLINLASPERMTRVRSIQAFREEILRALTLGADFLVAHPGSAMGVPMAQAVAAIADGFRQAARGIKFGGLRILVENTSGMGSAVGSRFEELAGILNAAADLPMGICLDTAHAFEAGFDLRGEAGLEQMLQRAESTVGLERVFVLHVNDSKTPLSSRVDRHQHVGKGKIGLEGFRRMLNHPMLSAGGAHGLPGRAFILETPIDAPGDDRRNVRVLWKLVGINVKQMPNAEDGFTMFRGARVKSAKGNARTGKKTKKKN
jgi:deoxyribonuclease-4